MRKNSLIILVLVLLFLFFFGYWIKCQKGIDLIKSFDLGNYLPVHFLKKHIVVFSPQAGDLLNESFESEKSANNWTKLWVREKSSVVQSYDPNGINKSRCLLIKSSSKKDWSYQHNKLFEVKEGDVFSFEGFVKTNGKEIYANLSMVLYDKDKKVIQWHYANEGVGKTDRWVKLERRFSIFKGANYIRFWLTGGGVGKSWFDNIKFKKQRTL